MNVEVGFTYDDMITQIIRPKSFVLNCGEKGGGKTCLSQRTLYLMAKKDWLTVTNTRYKIHRRIDGVVKPVRLENDGEIGVRMHSSIAEILSDICKHKEKKGLRAPAMVETDEFSSYFYKFEYWRPLTTAFLKLLPLMRKIDVCWMGTTAGEDLIPQELRTKKGGYCDWRLKKSVHLIRKLKSRRFISNPHVSATLKKVKDELGRSPTEEELLKRVVFIDDLSNGELDFPVYVSGEFPYRPDKQIVEEGHISYSEYSAAALTLGKRKNGLDLDLHEVIRIMSDEIEDDIPGRILGYIEGEKGESSVEKLTDEVFVKEFLRRAKGRSKWKKSEKTFNLVDLLEAKKSKGYEIIAGAKGK